MKRRQPNNRIAHYSQRKAGLQHRDLTTRELSVRSGSYNAEERSFEAVVATETPAQVMDWRTWDTIDEILVADGGEFPERCPLLDSHNRYQSKDVIGSALEFRREGRDWVGRGVFAKDDSDVDKIANRVRDGHIRDVSIGYTVLAYVDIPARTTQKINGREYTASERILRVTTRWRVMELSVCPIGADQQAKIRTPYQRSVSMNPRLLSYVRSLMHNPLATEDEARAFMASLHGVERTIANMLDYDLSDNSARSTVDLAIKSLGYSPDDPTKLLSTSPSRRARRQEEEDDEEEEREGETDEDDEEREFGDEEEEEETPRKKKRKRSRQTPEQIRADGARLERERVAALRTMASDVVPEATLQRAIDEGWSTRRAAPAFLQSVRDGRGEPLPGGAPAGHSRNSVTNYERDALVAALMLRGSTGGNGRDPKKINDPVARRFSFNPDTGVMRFIDASKDDAWCRSVDRGHELRALPMVEIARRMLEQNGVRVDPIPQQIVRAFETRATGVTVQAFVGIFTQTFGAIMLDSFLGTPDSTAPWTVERDNPNFLQNERHRVTKGRALTKHAKGGEAEDYDLADTTEYTRVFRYSGKTVIDEIDLINDTMFNAMRTATPDEMGESAKRLRPDLVYAILLANPNLQDGDALFNATYGNLLYDAELNKANLQRGTTVIETRQENGVNLDLEAKFVITPKALRYDIRELIRSATVVVTGDANTVRGSYNALEADALTPISDSRLDNGVTDPNSGTAYAGDTDDYYVMADASRHTIEVTYLRGSARVPQMRSGMLNNPGQWGIWFDAKHDLGAKALARAGMCKLTPTSEPT